MKPIRSCDVYIDGASRGNPGPAGIGVVVFEEQRAVHECSRYIGQTTNNVAEYLALLYALQDVLRLGYTHVTVKSDSELLVRQLNGQYRVRDAQLQLFHDLGRHAQRAFARCQIEHVPRTQNTLADRLAGQAVRSLKR